MREVKETASNLDMNFKLYEAQRRKILPAQVEEFTTSFRPL
jgi:hypothetical protein